MISNHSIKTSLPAMLLIHSFIHYYQQNILPSRDTLYSSFLFSTRIIKLSHLPNPRFYPSYFHHIFHIINIINNINTLSYSPIFVCLLLLQNYVRVPNYNHLLVHCSIITGGFPLGRGKEQARNLTIHRIEDIREVTTK